MLNIPEQIKNDLLGYSDTLEKYKNKQLDETRFKAYRVPMGVYEERSENSYMVRTRIPSGVINLEQILEVIKIANKYSQGEIHLTTRQDIQFHKVELDNTTNIINELLNVGIITRGTGGNTPRNIICDPFSGVSKEYQFDMTPYALATAEFLLNDPSTLALPRKYKIAFSQKYGKIADLGFIPKVKNGVEGFEIFGAGGLGNQSRVAIKLIDFDKKENYLYHIQAMKLLFEAHGDRTNKAKARIRHILIRLGEEEFIKVYNEFLDDVKSKLDLKDKFINNYKIEYKQTEGELIKELNYFVSEEKVKGRYSVYFHPTNGNMNVKVLKEITDKIEQLSYLPSIRFTTSQGFVIREILGEDIEKFETIRKKYFANNILSTSVACAGSSTCKLGLCLSQNLLNETIKRFKQNPELSNKLPSILISGCPNSCGQHHIGEIGLFGKARRNSGNLVPMYNIMFGAKFNDNINRLAKSFGDIPAKNLPDFLYELAENISEKVTFGKFIEENEDKVKKIMSKYQTIPSVEENEDIYKDFGSKELFSLKGRGPGECSVGVLDVIKMDILNAKTFLDEYNDKKDEKVLYKSALSAFKSLLILKGIDSNKDRVILKGFSEKFIDTGYVKVEIKDTINNLFDYKLEDLDSIKNEEKNITYLVNRIDAMFNSLSPKLEITIKKEFEPVKKVEKQKKSDNKEIKIADLRGVKCPINFVKAKIELSKIKGGETLGIYLDDGEPIKNVPGSIKAEGHDVISINEDFNGYNLLIVKKKIVNSEIKADHYVDITSDVCPMTYLNAKVELEELSEGQILEVRLTDGDPLCNVPPSIEKDGHKVLSQRKNPDGTYTIFIKRMY